MPVAAALAEATAGAAGARVVATQLLDQLLVDVDNAKTSLDPRLTVESPSCACSSAQKEKSSKVGMAASMGQNAGGFYQISLQQ